MLPTITPDEIDLPAGTILKFPGTIADYEEILSRLGDRSIPRLRFRDNQILLMSFLPEHGKEIDVIVDIVKAILRHQNMDWDSFHPITLRYGKEPGLEPDACFYIENYQAILGKRKLDMSIDPPPDLAIEIDVTSFTRIEDYISLAIPEVWIYKDAPSESDSDARAVRKNGELRIYSFTNNSYVETDTSLIFSDFDIKAIVARYVDRAWQAGSSVALKEFDQTLN